MLGEPCTHGLRHGILDPSSHRFAGKRTYTGNIHPVGLKILPGIAFIYITLIPQGIEIAQSFRKIISGIGRPVAELRVEVVMIIAFPWWQFTIISCPDSLQ